MANIGTLTPAERQQALNGVARTRGNRVVASTKTVYANNLVKFVRFLDKNYPQILDRNFRDSEHTLRDHTLKDQDGIASLSNAYIKDALLAVPAKPIISNWDDIDGTVICLFLEIWRKSDGYQPKIATYGNMRAAIRFLFKVYEKPIPCRVGEAMDEYLKGRSKELAAAEGRGRGTGNPHTGKAPMKYEIYRGLAKRFLKNKEQIKMRMASSWIFAHCFMVLQFNVMCRASNIVSLCYSHIQWDEDAIAVYLVHQKNDQHGEQRDLPRHVYANPFQPEICPILALSMLFAVCGFDHEKRLVLPGHAQYDRYRKTLRDMLDTDEWCKTQLPLLNLTSQQIGSHSLRKAACQFLNGGTTTAPNSNAVLARGGWQRGMMKTYNPDGEKAGDQYCGRLLAGLLPNSVQFATLPPHFKAGTPITDVNTAIAAIFPNAPEGQNKLLSMCLASLLYHKKWLRKKLPTEHPLRATALFTDSRMDVLGESVVLGIFEDDTMRATGITEHSQYLVEQQKLRKQIQSLREEVAKLPKLVGEELVRTLERRAVENSQVTPQGIHAFMS